MDQATLKSWLVYHPETGLFTWLRSRGNNILAGQQAGHLQLDGYVRLKFFNKQYLISRLAVLYMTGEMPAEVDHVDRNPSNNQWTNLRVCTRSQNRCNRPKTVKNTSGFKGVHWDRLSKKWRAQIGLYGKIKHLGRFATREEAAKAYERAAKTLHGEFVCTT